VPVSHPKVLRKKSKGQLRGRGFQKRKPGKKVHITHGRAGTEGTWLAGKDRGSKIKRSLLEDIKRTEILQKGTLWKEKALDTRAGGKKRKRFLTFCKKIWRSGNKAGDRRK